MACSNRHHALFLTLLVACFLPSLVSAGVSFKSLGNATISITGLKYDPATNTTSPLINQTVEHGEFIQVQWRPLPSAAAKLPLFSRAHVKLCYGPASSVNRGWRKVIDDITLDRQCKHKIIDVPWQNGTTTVNYELEKNLPGAVYRFRVYAVNAVGDPVAFGQTTTSQLFHFVAITGRSTGLDVAVGILSAVSGLVLMGYFLKEQKAKKRVKG